MCCERQASEKAGMWKTRKAKKWSVTKIEREQEGKIHDNWLA
jgi:hypothetical protein